VEPKPLLNAKQRQRPYPAQVQTLRRIAVRALNSERWYREQGDHDTAAKYAERAELAAHEMVRVARAAGDIRAAMPVARDWGRSL
jgi:hypothetical protein